MSRAFDNFSGQFEMLKDQAEIKAAEIALGPRYQGLFSGDTLERVAPPPKTDNGVLSSLVSFTKQTVEELQFRMSGEESSDSMAMLTYTKTYDRVPLGARCRRQGSGSKTFEYVPVNSTRTSKKSTPYFKRPPVSAMRS